MKTEIIHISSNGEGISEALAAIEETGLKQGFDTNEAKHLRLLSEETLELAGSITGRMDADFSADIRDDECEIRLEGKPTATSIKKSGLVSQYLDPSGIGRKIVYLFESPFEDLLKNEEAISEIGIQRVDERLMKEMGRQATDSYGRSMRMSYPYLTPVPQRKKKTGKRSTVPS